MLSYHSDPFAPLGGKKTGGMNLYVRNLSHSLAARGHQLDIFTRAWNKAPREKEKEPGLRLFSIPAGLPQSLETVNLVAAIPEFVDGIKSAVKLDYDVIHAHYWMSGLAALALIELVPIPLVSTMHTLGLVKERVLSVPEQLIQQRVLGERRVLRASAKVVASTPAEEAELQWLYEVKRQQVCVISPGVDSSLFNPAEKGTSREKLGIPADQQAVLFVGRLDPIKGLETLIEAIGLINQQPRTPSHLYVVGGELDPNGTLVGELGQKLMEFARKIGMADLIHFLGQRKQSDLPTFYNAADIVVLPSHYESFGLVALEAMSCGRPVVVSKVGGLAELVEDMETGLHAAVGDAADFAQKMRRIFDDPSLASSLSRNARRYALENSWEECARSIETLYEIVAGHKVDHGNQNAT